MYAPGIAPYSGKTVEGKTNTIPVFMETCDLVCKGETVMT